MRDVCRFCDRQVFGRGLCNAHYLREKKAGTLANFLAKRERPLRDIFLEKVDKQPGGCWLWTGATVTGKFNYGLAWVDGKPKRAHRVAHELFIAPITDDDVICHRCDVPLCVNPAHLFKGDRGDNNRDTKSKGRHSYGTRNGHCRLSEAEVALIKSSGLDRAILAETYGVTEHYVWRLQTGRARLQG